MQEDRTRPHGLWNVDPRASALLAKLLQSLGLKQRRQSEPPTLRARNSQAVHFVAMSRPREHTAPSLHFPPIKPAAPEKPRCP